jgi:hypothetical protein
MILCPWCEQYIIIEELNCGIFRHAIMKNGEPTRNQRRVRVFDYDQTNLGLW